MPRREGYASAGRCVDGLGEDPLDPEVACRTPETDPRKASPGGPEAILCEAARAKVTPYTLD